MTYGGCREAAPPRARGHTCLRAPRWTAWRRARTSHGRAAATPWTATRNGRCGRWGIPTTAPPPRLRTTVGDATFAVAVPRAVRRRADPAPPMHGGLEVWRLPRRQLPGLARRPHARPARRAAHASTPRLAQARHAQDLAMQGCIPRPSSTRVRWISSARTTPLAGARFPLARWLVPGTIAARRLCPSR